jgi:hypothetical protein
MASAPVIESARVTVGETNVLLDIRWRNVSYTATGKVDGSESRHTILIVTSAETAGTENTNGSKRQHQRRLNRNRRLARSRRIAITGLC